MLKVIHQLCRSRRTSSLAVTSIASRLGIGQLKQAPTALLDGAQDVLETKRPESDVSTADNAPPAHWMPSPGVQGGSADDAKAGFREPGRNLGCLWRQAFVHKNPGASPPAIPAQPQTLPPVPRYWAVHAPNALLDATGQVRLYHERAVAHGNYGRFFRAITPKGALRGLKEVFTRPLGTSHRLQITPDHALDAEIEMTQRLGIMVHGVHHTADGRVYVETDLFVGDLKAVFAAMPRLERASAARDALRQQALQLDRLHRQGFMHRDVKNANSFYRQDGKVQVADPGLATHHIPGQLHGWVGSPVYMAPEVWGAWPNKVCTYDSKVDSWSLGIAACESLTQAPWPMAAAETLEQARMMLESLHRFRQRMMANGAVDIQKMQAAGRAAPRATWSYFFGRTALADASMCAFILDRMLDPNPETRATMREVAALAAQTNDASGSSASAAFLHASLLNESYAKDVAALRRRLNAPAP